MVVFKLFQMFVILMISFTAAVTHHRSFISVKVGDEVTLPCKDVKDYQDKCLSATWIFSNLTTGPSVTLFQYGQITSEAVSKSDRLNVTEKCSLVIKKATFEDAGLYMCRQFISGPTVPHSDVHLIVAHTVNEHYSSISVRVRDEATLLCEDVKDYQDKCHSITWIFTSGPAVTLFEGGQIHREAASKLDRLSVTEKCSLVIKKVTSQDVGLYMCRQVLPGQTVTNSWVDLCVGQRHNVATPLQTKILTTTKRTPKSTTTPTTAATPPPPSPPSTTKFPTTTKTSTNATKATSRPTTIDPAAGRLLITNWLNTVTGLKVVVIPVAVVLATLLIIVVAVIRWKKAKGNNTQVDDNTADPPDGVSYASIRFKKKTKSKAQVQGEDDKVTYSTLNTSSISAGASTDPRNLYASINKTNT